MVANFSAAVPHSVDTAEDLYAVEGASWNDIGNQLVYSIGTQMLVAVVSCPLSWCYDRFVKTSTGAGTLHVLKNKVLGNAYVPPLWPYAYFPSLLAIANCFLSALTVYFWVAKTYRQTVDTWMMNVEYSISSFYILHYILTLMINEFSLRFVASIDSVVELWSIVPLLMQGTVTDTWLSCSYIRVYCLYRYFKCLLQLGYNPFELSEVTKQLILSVLKFLTMTITLSGSMFVFEVLGPISGFEDQPISTGMGDISFFSMVYFMLTTISTVGYGDLSPVTMLGRCLTFICVLGGVVFFSVESGRVMELQRREDSGEGRYKPKKSRGRHIVICGGAIENSTVNILTSILEELTNPDVCGGDAQVPDVVLLGSRELSPSLRETFKTDGRYKKSVLYLRGTPFEEEDTERCCLKTCEMLLILPNLNSTEPDKEDRYGILLASSILKVHLDLPMRLVLLRPENRRLASQFNINRVDCYALNEMKANMLAQSVRCPGISTLLLGLAHHPGAVEQKLMDTNPWIAEFNKGTSHRVYGALLRESLCGQSFTAVCCHVYSETGALVIACQVTGRVLTNPGNSSVIGRSTVVFIVAESAAQISKISKKGDAWKLAFRRQRKAHKALNENSESSAACDLNPISIIEEESPSHSPNSLLSMKQDAMQFLHPAFGFVNSMFRKQEEAAKSDEQPGGQRRTSQIEVFATRKRNAAPGERPSSFEQDRKAKEGTGQERKRSLSTSEVAEGNGTEEQRPSVDKRMAVVQKMSPRHMPQRYMRVSRFKSEMEDQLEFLSDHGSMCSYPNFGTMQSNASFASFAGYAENSVCREGAVFPSVLQCARGHVVVLAVGELLTQQLLSFIKPLRQSYLIVWKEIVIVSLNELSPQLLVFPGVHGVIADPLHYNTLQRACVEDASQVVILDGYPPTLEVHLMDQRTILCNGVVESYLAPFPEKNVPKITVLHNRDSLKQLVGDAVASGKEEDGAVPRSKGSVSDEWCPEIKPEDQIFDAIQTVSGVRHFSKLWLRKSQDRIKRIRGNRLKTDSKRKRSIIIEAIALKNPNKRVTRLSFPPEIHPHFVSGSSMALPDITRFVAHAIHTPGVLELIANILAPGLENMPAMIWTMPLDGEMQRHQTWGELCQECLQEGAIPLALFRGANSQPQKAPDSDEGRAPVISFATASKLISEEAAPRRPFVVTNPPRMAKPTRHDRALVLAPRRWAYANCISTEIIELFSAKHSSALMLVCFREWRVYGDAMSDVDEASVCDEIEQQAEPTSDALPREPSMGFVAVTELPGTPITKDRGGLERQRFQALDASANPAETQQREGTRGSARGLQSCQETETLSQMEDVVKFKMKTISQLAEGLNAVQIEEVIRLLHKETPSR
ncbi:hypothetical protein CYMTET_56881 [Cymbomonas tetramitiformis]|uniref:Uncharacterized protein n=1 Tax=Cymbomonas tetramitiformis TaxID=36881 RepID=A0AAE0BAE3_9CHLO|nr:hypothetical protein CYMTET_56881 [Cymbomonas tetramitiformis]